MLGSAWPAWHCVDTCIACNPYTYLEVYYALVTASEQNEAICLSCSVQYILQFVSPPLNWRNSWAVPSMGVLILRLCLIPWLSVIHFMYLWHYFCMHVFFFTSLLCVSLSVAVVLFISVLLSFLSECSKWSKPLHVCTLTLLTCRYSSTLHLVITGPVTHMNTNKYCNHTII